MQSGPVGRFLLTPMNLTAVPYHVASERPAAVTVWLRAFLGDRQRAAFYATSLMAVLGWVWFAGKDLPWDTVHYHMYAGYSVFNDRLGVDYFPAGGQAYLTPYSYAPLYLMGRAGWPSLAVGAVFACMHVSILWLTWELARLVSRGSDGSASAIVPWGAAALAFANPVLLQELGSSFNDVTTGALAVGGYVALASAFNGHAQWKVAVAGFLLGSAAALKLTNGIFAVVPALPLVLGCVSGTRGRAKMLLIFGAALATALLLVAGPWAWALWKAFGNPLFPMFDGIFNPQPVPGASSSVAPEVHPLMKLLGVLDAIRDPRFLPSSLYEALLKPFDILAAGRKIHTETMAADVRYAAVLVVLPVSWLIGVWRRRSNSALELVGQETNSRVLTCLAFSLGLAWILWVLVSGNSRYALPMACVTSVVFAASVQRFLSFNPMAVRLIVGVVLSIQVLFLSAAADFRWGAQPWDGPWIQATVPSELQKEPSLYLLMEAQSQSILFPYLAPGSAFAGLGPDVDPDSAFGRRINELIQAHVPRLRMLTLVKALEPNGSPIAPAASTFDYPLRRFGLSVDTNDCTYLQYRGDPGVLSSTSPHSGPRDQVHVYSCRLVPGDNLPVAELAGKQVADRVLDRVEAACAGMLRAQHQSSVRSGGIWRRNYADTAAWVNDDGWVRFADLFRGGGDISGLGSVKEWLDTPPKLKCWRSKGRFYVERAEN